MKIIVWFNQDLRLTDHPALSAALKEASQVYCVYVFDPQNPQGPVGAARWWLHHSLLRLGGQLKTNNGQLILRSGTSADALLTLVNELAADAVYMSRSYEPYITSEQTRLYQALAEQNRAAKRFAGYLLLEPDSIANKQGKPFQVFTPFYRHTRDLLGTVVKPAHKPSFSALAAADATINSDTLASWQLLPNQPNWAEEFGEQATPGEIGSETALNLAIAEVVENYPQQRDIPAVEGTSRLSAHLHFGEISPRQVIRRLHGSREFDLETAGPFIRQLFWREFNYYLMYHFPHIRTGAFKPKFDHFPWRKNSEFLLAWQQGRTGYPIVDAGMRQLWRTGWMHNRVRMICASFLTKHLLIHWQEGAEWFWQTLLDADCANNIGGWQWVAGSGADASPYFRIFNPILQGEKFDPQGDYVRTWVPELALLPPAFIHKPWQAPEALLSKAGIALGRHYPQPIVNHEAAREAALAAYKLIQ